MTRQSSGRVWVATTASLLGWSLDLFDLFILLYIAPTIGPLFFPGTSPTLSLASVYASFAVTLLMRPVGSALFGSYADRNGRRAGLILAVIGVGATTGLLGCLPTFETAGAIAPILFILIRLVQGIFVGGVVASTHTLGTETITPRLRGFFSGVMASGAGLGALVASAAFTLVAVLFPGPDFAVWGWRVMFWIGMACAGVSLLMFRAVEESPLWQQARRSAAPSSPLRNVLGGQYRSVLALNVLITIGAGSTYYLTAGYLPVYLSKINALPQATAGVLLMVSSVVVVLISPVLGHLSEVFGRKPALMTTALANILLLPALFFALRDAGNDSPYLTALIASAIVSLGNSGCAMALIYLNESFPTSIRSTGTALSWNIGYAVGGMMPTLVTVFSTSVSDIPASLAIGLVAVNVIFLVGTLLIPASRGKPSLMNEAVEPVGGAELPLV